MTIGITLDADNLTHKWGFGDGDMLTDWYWDVYDEPCHVDEDELLMDLVRKFLLPELEKSGYTVELVRIWTNHNPIRAEKVNGEEMDWYREEWEFFKPTIRVDVTKEQIEEMVGAPPSRGNPIL